MQAHHPSAKVPRELWLTSLRQDLGVTRSQNSEYNSGASRSVSRASTTPEYLKEAFGMRKPKHSRLAKNGYVPGTPNYKEREDMYDEIIKLKKVIQAHKTENDVTKTKLRRSEEENSKKEKHIEQLLDPSKSSEYTRNLVDKNNVNGIVRGLKQKILKLEQQCREKENSLNKLQTDLKTSDIEEMRITMETYYEEIQRLRLLLSAEKKDPAESRESQKLLNSTRLRLSKTIKLLQEENKTLKMDLDRVLSNSPATSTARESRGAGIGLEQISWRWQKYGGTAPSAGLRCGAARAAGILPPAGKPSLSWTGEEAEGRPQRAAGATRQQGCRSKEIDPREV
uniref:IQ domain-containing protein E n=1 Tax=Callorhinchus milii TaxID=7868 RepID=A0A4W3IAB1_CALMI